MLVAIWCTAILAGLVFGLGLWISLNRLITGSFYFGAGDPKSFTTKLARAHGNTAEFAPILALLMICLGMHGAAHWMLLSMVGATASRILVVVGFLTSPTLSTISMVKAVGAVGTYVFGLALTAALVMRV